MRTMLIYGATGKAGRLVMERAIERGWGTLRAEPTENNIQHGSASYCDVADALVKLAGDAERTWERKALFFNYAGAAG